MEPSLCEPFEYPFSPVYSYSRFVFSSNGGVFGSLYGTPIINLPQSAVLGTYLFYYPFVTLQTYTLVTGMHSIKEKPVVVNGQIVIRPIMVVALTYDHRLLDGREAVTFLGTPINFKYQSQFVY